jgi:hypothetical protein
MPSFIKCNCKTKRKDADELFRMYFKKSSSSKNKSSRTAVFSASFLKGTLTAGEYFIQQNKYSLFRRLKMPSVFRILE